ncbi:replicative DNA helicase [Nitrosomonadales bacterium]|nr:replicative DNA helicase [Nitrosomonadales bacterium]
MADDKINNLKLPPHSIEAEQSLLGGLLIDNSALAQITDIISVKDFYRQDHRLIFTHIINLINLDNPADVITVAESLEKKSELASTGGVVYLGSLAENMPSVANIRGYAKIIRDNSVLRNLITVGSDIVEGAFSPKGKEAQALLDEMEAKLFSIAEDQNNRLGYKDFQKVVADVVRNLEDRGQNPGTVNGLATGFTDLDKLTTGLHGGELVIIAGRPSMGKTALAMNIAETCALKQNKAVAIFSMEMGAEQIVTRLLGSVAKVHQQKMRTGELTDADWAEIADALGKLNEAPIFIDEGSALNSYELRARARRLHHSTEGGLGLIVVDYIQLMSPLGNGNGENRATEISEISRSLKSLAKELNIPVIALSQLNRNVDSRPDKRPQMSDLRESGAIEQDADVIMFIYREEVYNQETLDKGIADIILAKQRSGPIGDIKLTFVGEYTRFENYANPGYESGY